MSDNEKMARYYYTLEYRKGIMKITEQAIDSL
jgi:hypothetical protein